MKNQANLKTLRDEVKGLDQQILTAIKKRLDLAKAIGQIKMDESLPVKDYAVEKEVISRNRNQARSLGLYEKCAEDLSRLMIKYAVLAQDEYHTKRRAKNPMAAKNILIVGGFGHMGLWLAEFFESFGHTVSILDQKKVANDRFKVFHDMSEAIQDQQVIVLATPISVTSSIIDALVSQRTEALVFDICSLKTPIIKAIKNALKSGMKITSLHPMFGPNIDLLSGQNIIFCEQNQDLTADALSLFNNTTANLIKIPLEKHDQYISYVLGLSHLTNLIFGRVLTSSGYDFSDLKHVASTTFRSQLDVVMPVVNENQDLYFEIQAENGFTGQLFERIEGELLHFKESILGKSKEDFCELMDSSRIYLKE
jgi:chorismate mutase / prephenate dehydrogenase